MAARPLKAGSLATRYAFFGLFLTGIALGAGLDLPRFMPIRDLPALLADRHVTMSAPDLDQTATWYENNLTFSQMAAWTQPPRLSRICLTRGSNLLELVNGTGLQAPVQLAKTRHGAYIEHRIPLVLNNVDGEFEILKERGIQVLAGPRIFTHENRYAVIIRDLNRRALELQEVF